MEKQKTFSIIEDLFNNIADLPLNSTHLRFSRIAYLERLVTGLTIGGFITPHEYEAYQTRIHGLSTC